MGQALADLLDPLDIESSRSPGIPGGDDLMAQMAGEEIDRLLPPAGVERQMAGSVPAGPSPEPFAAPAGHHPISASAATAVSSDIDGDLLPDAPAHGQAARAGPSPAAADDDPAMTAQLDEAFEELTKAGASSQAVPAGAGASFAPRPALVGPADDISLVNGAPPPESSASPALPAIDTPMIGRRDMSQGVARKIAVVAIITMAAILIYAVLFRR